LIGAVIAALLPWSARLGVATVPELPTAALTLFAMATLIRDVETGWRIWGGAALLAATLSRYEVWFVAAGFAAFCAWDAWRAGAGKRRDLVLGAGLGALGPFAWTLWNRVSHGDALHFVARVTAFHHASASHAQLSAAVGYPEAMLRAEPEIVVAAAAAAIIALTFEPARTVLTRCARLWIVAGVCLLALTLSAAREGAPTHHAERAVLVVFLFGAVFTAAVAAELLRSMSLAASAVRTGAVVGASVLAGLLVRSRPSVEAPSVDRSAETTVGEAASRRLSRGSRLLIEVLDYGYFAVIAAFGRPEDAITDRDPDPRKAATSSSFERTADLEAKLEQTGAAAIVARQRSLMPNPPEVVSGEWCFSRVPERAR
jgi:hypothetical protein